MSLSILAIFHRTSHGLRSGALDQREVMLLSFGALFVAVSAAIALVAIDPVTRGFGSVPVMQSTGDHMVRQQLLAFWTEHGLLRRAATFLLVDGLVFAPAWGLFLLALLCRLYWLVSDDGSPPTVAALLPLPWKLIAAVPALGVLAKWIDDGLSLYALHLARGSIVALPDWLHASIKVVTCGALVLFGLAVLIALWLFAKWFFTPMESPGTGEAVRMSHRFDRARLRASIADMLWRSKYAVIVLVFFGLLVLGMDQTRDALVRQIIDLKYYPGKALLGMAITLVGLTLLARASWLWPRLVLRLRSPDMQSPVSGAEVFAKWWCRTLGLVPFIVVDLVIAQSIHNVAPDSPALGWFAAAQATIVVLALIFLYRVASRIPKHGRHIGYYERSADEHTAREDLGVLPGLIAWGAPLLFLFARWAGLAEWTPPLALAVIECGLAAWAGVLGWVAYESRRYAIPYVLLAALIVGGLSFFGLSEAHRVRTWTSDIAAFTPASLRHLFLLTVVLAALSLAVAWHWSRRTASLMGRAITGVLALAAVIALLWHHDRAPGTLYRIACPTGNASCAARNNLDVAMTAWLNRIHDDLALRVDRGEAVDPVPVYLVSAEGGGIRSAYWTASVLHRLRYRMDERFDLHTFSLAGVSGGALGVAVFRACEEAHTSADDVGRCIRRFGETDLWTQLLGGLLFEDALANIVPTFFCKSPGCGVFGRSYWFEGAMESVVPLMAQGLASRPGARDRTPHLFFNVTTAETGERAIESDVAIDCLHFPGARDLLRMIDADLRLSTAAHNSARFPYTNPVGAIYGPNCSDELCAVETPLSAGRPRLCARAQDGGYFDDSATLSTIDILRALRRCLSEDGCGIDPENGGLSAQSRTQLRAWVRPVMIAIRNEARFVASPRDKDAPPCVASDDPHRLPEFPKQAAPLRLFASVSSAPLTLFNTREAHTHHADATLQRDAQALWQDLKIIPIEPRLPCGKTIEWIADAAMRRFDLLADDTLYPSGWLLSAQALDGIERQADRIVP
jgi:hypothetical protein